MHLFSISVYCRLEWFVCEWIFQQVTLKFNGKKIRFMLFLWVTQKRAKIFWRIINNQIIMFTFYSTSLWSLKMILWIDKQHMDFLNSWKINFDNVCTEEFCFLSFIVYELFLSEKIDDEHFSIFLRFTLFYYNKLLSYMLKTEICSLMNLGIIFNRYCTLLNKYW